MRPTFSCSDLTTVCRAGTPPEPPPARAVPTAAAPAPAAAIASAPASELCSYVRFPFGPPPFPAAGGGNAATLVTGHGLDLRVEEQRDHLGADRAVQLQEHLVPLVAVLDERVLLRHAAQVDALAHVVHVLEVLAPALVDDLEHDVALEVAHQLGSFSSISFSS